MLKQNLLIFLVATTVILFTFSEYSGKILSDHEYVGTTTCGMCHKKEASGQQLKIWKESKHSQAYKILQTEDADKIALEKGFTTKAVETEECLSCHSTGYKIDESLIGKKFSVEDGVQCETCHGPGSEYKSKKIMKDRKLAIQKGLLIYDNPEELCVSCHNDKSPTFKGFNFEEMWSKVQHNIPE